jgi:coatomer subunit beta'
MNPRLKGKNNVAFVSMFMLKDIDGCLDLLIETNRIPEAAFMARTYAPSRVSEIIELWKSDLSKVNKKAAEALADPANNLELFEGFEEAIEAEKVVSQELGNLEGCLRVWCGRCGRQAY